MEIITMLLRCTLDMKDDVELMMQVDGGTEKQGQAGVIGVFDAWWGFWLLFKARRLFICNK